MLPELEGVRSGERHGIYELLETVAAMSHRMFTDSRFQKLFERYVVQLDGMPGFWQLAVNLANALETLPRTYKASWGTTHDYVRSIEETVDALYDGALGRKALDLHDGRTLASFVTLVPM